MRVDLLQLLALLLLGACGSRSGSAALSPSDYKSKPRSGSRSPASDGKMVCSNMELHQVLPADSFPNRTLTL